VTGVGMGVPTHVQESRAGVVVFRLAEPAAPQASARGRRTAR